MEVLGLCGAGWSEGERGGSYPVGEERANEREVWEEFWIDDVEALPSVEKEYSAKRFFAECYIKHSAKLFYFLFAFFTSFSLCILINSYQLPQQYIVKFT